MHTKSIFMKIYAYIKKNVIYNYMKYRYRYVYIILLYIVYLIISYISSLYWDIELLSTDTYYAQIWYEMPYVYYVYITSIEYILYIIYKEHVTA